MPENKIQLGIHDYPHFLDKDTTRDEFLIHLHDGRGIKELKHAFIDI